MAPYSDSSEEVTLGISDEFFWFDICDAPFVYVSWGDVTLGDEIS